MAASLPICSFNQTHSPCPIPNHLNHHGFNQQIQFKPKQQSPSPQHKPVLSLLQFHNLRTIIAVLHPSPQQPNHQSNQSHVQRPQICPCITITNPSIFKAFHHQPVTSSVHSPQSPKPKSSNQTSLTDLHHPPVPKSTIQISSINSPNPTTTSSFQTCNSRTTITTPFSAIPQRIPANRIPIPNQTSQKSQPNQNLQIHSPSHAAPPRSQLPTTAHTSPPLQSRVAQPPRRFQQLKDCRRRSLFLVAAQNTTGPCPPSQQRRALNPSTQAGVARAQSAVEPSSPSSLAAPSNRRCRRLLQYIAARALPRKPTPLQHRSRNPAPPRTQATIAKPPSVAALSGRIPELLKAAAAVPMPDQNPCSLPHGSPSTIAA